MYLQLKLNFSKKFPTFIIPSHQNQFIQEIVFNNAPTKKTVVAITIKSAVANSFQENHFHDQQFNLRELKIIWGRRAFISLATNSSCRPYVTTR